MVETIVISFTSISTTGIRKRTTCVQSMVGFKGKDHQKHFKLMDLSISHSVMSEIKWWHMRRDHCCLYITSVARKVTRIIRCE